MTSDPPRSVLAQGEQALRALDKVLQDEPVKVGPDFSAAIAELTALRERMIGRLRQAGSDPGDVPELERLNGVLTVVISGHYPLGQVPWPMVESGREALAALLPDLQGNPLFA